jgi:hypothetical protein
VNPKAGLDTMKRKILGLSRIEPRSSSPLPVAILTYIGPSYSYGTGSCTDITWTERASLLISYIRTRESAVISKRIVYMFLAFPGEEQVAFEMPCLFV